MMIAQKPESVPGRAVADDGVVLLDGPDGVAVAMTPECAEETARELLTAAGEAMRQRDAAAPTWPDSGSA